MSQLQKNLLKSKLPPLPNPPKAPATHSRFSGLVPKRKTKNYEPSDWKEYFQQSHDVVINENSFRVYLNGCSGPMLVLLHGGGHSALSWASFVKSIGNICDCQALAFDFRGHGNTSTTDDMDLSADTLASDVAAIVKTILPDPPPPLVLVGHSMGGAIAVHVGAKNLLPSLRGLIVIDAVEGTALDALSSMGTFLRSRPSYFQTLEQAVEWSVRSGQLKNLGSAKISMPGQLKKIPKSLVDKSDKSFQQNSETIHEETEGSGENANETNEEEFVYTWRIDLSKTEPYWKGWFENMSERFLSCPAPKMLLLAGIDRLDKTLTIGQMQGKFQMQVLGNCGHMVHEDKPDSVSEIVLGFLMRQQLTQAKAGVKRHMPAC